MKIAVLSDTRLPTSATFCGHGLGKINLAIAEGLRARGHHVTLYAGVGSSWSGELVVASNENVFYNSNNIKEYDVIIDGGHEHQLARLNSDAPVINLSHDREKAPGRNAVFVSAAHRAYHRQPGRVIYNGINVDDFPFVADHDGYVAFLAPQFAHKGPNAAIQAAQLAGVPLKMAGPGAPPLGVDHVGPLSGSEKFAFLGHARALLVPAGIESGGITCLEAAAVGTPVIAFALGGLVEYVGDGITGYLVDSTDAMADAIERVSALSPSVARQWVKDCRNTEQMIDGYERACEDITRGERW